MGLKDKAQRDEDETLADQFDLLGMAISRTQDNLKRLAQPENANSSARKELLADIEKNINKANSFVNSINMEIKMIGDKEGSKKTEYTEVDRMPQQDI